MSVLNRFIAYFVSILSTACLLGTISASQAAAKEVLIMSTAPTQSVEKTEELYGPLAKYLTERSGKEVKLVPARNFLEYNGKNRGEVAAGQELLFTAILEQMWISPYSSSGLYTKNAISPKLIVSRSTAMIKKGGYRSFTNFCCSISTSLFSISEIWPKTLSRASSSPAWK